MSIMIENLDRLNRKERYFLIGMALGNPRFNISTSFREQLSDQFQMTIPSNVFVAMDYHLNWISAAVELSFGTPTKNHIYDNADGLIDGTQEDVDLIVAFDDTSSHTHLIMLEAKGVTAFLNNQFEHKMNRFQQIFGANCEKWPRIKPHFGLVSPRKSEKLHLDKCPKWLKVDGKIPWIEMPIPQDRLVLFGCDESGKPDKYRPNWTVRDM